MNYYRFFILLISLITITNGCIEDSTPAPVIGIENPPANFAQTNALLSFSINVNAPNKIKSIEVTETFGSDTRILTGYPKTTGFLSETTDEFEYTYQTADSAQKVTIGFSVVDMNGQKGTVNFPLTVSNGANPDEGGAINTYLVKVLGNPLTTGGKFIATSTGTVYTLEDAKTNSDKVDFGYANGTTANTGFIIGAPADDLIMSLHGNSSSEVSSWSVKNKTTFMETSLTASDFNAITKDAQLVANDPGADFVQGENSRLFASEIEVNDVFAFRTVAGKVGLAKVTARSGTSTTTGGISLSIKIQK
jgi:hypothetical protein